MGKKNGTTVPEFILLGLADNPELRVFLFLLLLLIYGVMVLSNLGMIALSQETLNWTIALHCGLFQWNHRHHDHLHFLLFILIIILRKCSAEGRWKAFSICVSHLTVIIVFHGTILFPFFQPSLATVWILTMWLWCSTLQWFPCWILWSIAWETKIWKKCSEKQCAPKYFPRQYLLIRTQSPKGEAGGGVNKWASVFEWR